MNIAFDLQALQSVNNIGGIGNYNLDFLRTLFVNYKDNKYILIFNSNSSTQFIEKIDKSRNSHMFGVPYLPGNDMNDRNIWVNYLYLRSISSDIFHILSPFEDQKNTVIHTNNILGKLVVTIYDFIPYIFKDYYLTSEEKRHRYLERLEIVRSADLIFSISEATRNDAIRLFNIPSKKIINIGIAPSDNYYKYPTSKTHHINKIRQKFSISGNFILTVSNLDHRKNLLSLLKAYTSLPKQLLSQYSLVIVTNSTPKSVRENVDISNYLNSISNHNIIMLYSITDEELCSLYNICDLFVYASLYEGGGLPVIEAMKCGAPVVASNSSSIPELVGRSDNLFSPTNIDEIAETIEKVLSNKNYSNELRNFGIQFANTITWEKVVGRAINGYMALVSN